MEGNEAGPIRIFQLFPAVCLLRGLGEEMLCTKAGRQRCSVAKAKAQQAGTA